MISHVAKYLLEPVASLELAETASLCKRWLRRNWSAASFFLEVLAFQHRIDGADAINSSVENGLHITRPLN
tara:strand:- start:1702 stop:1914 length:213 start_codon:yes stop_codon:yes gene_type:complete